jgi:fused signal recognition particle receptor
MFEKLKKIFAGVDKAELADVEEALIGADVSAGLAAELALRARKEKPGDIRVFLRAALAEIMRPCEARLEPGPAPYSIAFVGVNGAGKTTTIGKLAHKFVRGGKRVLCVACDTFRASATEQLGIWAARAGADLMSRPGTSPSALAYDGMAAGAGYDAVMFDTAGRLGNNSGLMDELKKVIKTIGKVRAGAPNATILVLDGSAGQNSIAQMETFGADIEISGLAITKTEGTAKGGFMATLAWKYKKPIYFVANGEGDGDLHQFNADEFASRLV